MEKLPNHLLLEIIRAIAEKSTDIDHEGVMEGMMEKNCRLLDNRSSEQNNSSDQCHRPENYDWNRNKTCVICPWSMLVYFSSGTKNKRKITNLAKMSQIPSNHNVRRRKFVNNFLTRFVLTSFFVSRILTSFLLTRFFSQFISVSKKQILTICNFQRWKSWGFQGLRVGSLRIGDKTRHCTL